MTTKQATFVANVDRYCDGLVVNLGCLGAECEFADGESDHQCGVFFSWTDCDSCGSTLSGDRHPATGITDDGTAIMLNICTGCVVYHEHGALPTEG